MATAEKDKLVRIERGTAVVVGAVAAVERGEVGYSGPRGVSRDISLVRCGPVGKNKILGLSYKMAPRSDRLRIG